MKLGIVGMLPSDFRTITAEHLAAIRALQLSGAAFHAPGSQLFAVTNAECQAVRQTFADAGMDMVQFGIGYGDCLFSPDGAVRDKVVREIERGVEVGRELGVQAVLIRTGSLNPRGAYSPSRHNHEPASMQRLLDTLGRVAKKADSEGQKVVIETHVLTITNSPETNRAVIEKLGSLNLSVVMDFVNHFQTLSQVYNSTARLNHIFDVMGPVGGVVGHCKDITVRDGFVMHLDEEVPGEGELDLATALRRWHALSPNNYMLLEHLPNEKYPLAAANTHRIAKEAGVPIE